MANTPATVNIGASFAHDTYRGLGVGVYEGVGSKFNIGSVGLNASVQWGVNPYGGGYVSAGIGATYGPVSVGLSATTNFKSLDAGFSYGLNYSFGTDNNGQGWGVSLIGSTISTSGGKPSLSIGGLTSSISNSKSGQVSTSSHSWNIDIPVYYGINLSLGHSKVRYWTNETTNVTTWGSLNNPNDLPMATTTAKAGTIMPMTNIHCWKTPARQQRDLRRSHYGTGSIFPGLRRIQCQCAGTGRLHAAVYVSGPHSQPEYLQRKHADGPVLPARCNELQPFLSVRR